MNDDALTAAWRGFVAESVELRRVWAMVALHDGADAEKVGWLFGFTTATTQRQGATPEGQRQPQG